MDKYTILWSLPILFVAVGSLFLILGIAKRSERIIFASIGKRKGARPRK